MISTRFPGIMIYSTKRDHAAAVTAHETKFVRIRQDGKRSVAEMLPHLKNARYSYLTIDEMSNGKTSPENTAVLYEKEHF